MTPGGDPAETARSAARLLQRSRRDATSALLGILADLDDKATARLQSLLRLGDPNAEVAIAYRVKERLREFYRAHGLSEARTILGELIEHCLRPTMPHELRKLGRTLKHWFDKICNYHLARVSNGPTRR
jgi:transposase